MPVLESFLMKYTLQGAEEVIKKNKQIKESSDKLEESEKKTDKTTFNLNETFKKISSNGLTNLVLKTVSAITPMILLGKAIQNTLRFSQEADELDFLSKKAGTTVENIQAIAKASGSTSQEVASVFENINQELQGLRKGETSNLLNDIAVKYGVSFVGAQGLKTSQEIFDNIAKKMSQLSTNEQIDLASRLGLDDKTTKLMMQGYEKYKKTVEDAKKFNVFDKDYIENTKKLRENLKNITNEFYFIAGVISRILLPVVNFFTSAISTAVSFLTEHTGTVESVLLALSVVLGVKMVTSVNLLIPSLIKLGITLWSSLAPLLPFIALFGALFLVIQDIYSWINGEESIAGLLFGDFDKIKDKVLNFFKKFKEDFISVYEFIKEKMNNLFKWFNPKNWFKSKEKQEKIDDMLIAGSNTVNNQSTLNNQYNNKNANLTIDKIEIITKDNAKIISEDISTTLENTVVNINDAMR